MPAGFFCDEASIGYNAYTILKTGKDEFNIHFPVFFQAFGEYKSPIQIYSTVPSIALFGLNEFSVRLTSVIYGILSLFAIYLLTRELFKHYKHSSFVALLSAFFLAISPWAIHFSRVAFELMPFVFFTTLGLFVFLKAQEKPKLLAFAVFLFSLALYSYFPARIFIPLFGIGLFFIYLPFFIKNKKETIFSAILLLIILIPFFQNLFTTGGFARWQQVNIFSQPPKNETIFQHIASNYFRHFSADFLFLRGDIDMPGQFITRHSVRYIGELYFFQLPLIGLGLYLMAKEKKHKSFIVLLTWLILYPVGSMFTTDSSPQATRSIIGIVPLQIFSAIGVEYLFNLLSKLKKLLHVTIILMCTFIVGISFANYTYLYFFTYQNYSSDYWGWQYGPREIIPYFVSQKDFYDEEILQPEFNSAEIFFKFYSPNNCKKCIVGNPDDKYNKSKKQLFAVTTAYLKDHPQYKMTTKKTVYYPDNSVAFLIGEIVQ